MKRRTKLTIWYTLVGIVGMALILSAIFLMRRGKGFRTYKNKRAHFLIKYPAAWRKNLRNTGGSVVTFISKQTNDLDYFNENVSVVVQDLSDNPMDLASFTELSIRQMEVVFESNITVLADIDIKVSGLPGHKFVFIVKSTDSPDLKFHIIWTLQETTAFQITYVALEPTFDEYIPIVNKMFNSFKVLE